MCPLKIEVLLDGADYPDCPLRSDLNTCQVVSGSQINDCPSLDDETGEWTVPDWCPLKHGGVLVEQKGAPA